MTATRKTGPLTNAELVSIWRSVVDAEYARPMIEGGDGHGLEVPGQVAEQLAFVSLGVDRTTQGLFVLPWSGETQDPAGGELLSAVTIHITRTSRFTVPVVFEAGSALFAEQVTDFAPGGGIVVPTGRRYVVLNTVGLGPGDAELDVACVAIAPGTGFDFPLPGTITRFVQPGAGVSNVGATVIPGPGATHTIVAGPEPDVPSPSHIGLFLEFVAGANTGQVRRIVGYLPPGPSDGGAFIVAATTVILGSVFGTFQPGEEVDQAVSLARGRFIDVSDSGGALVLDRITGTFDAVNPIIGVFSGAAFLPTAVDVPAAMVPEAAAAWHVSTFEELGLAATNPESPAGGRLGMLDQLGSERTIFRAPGEGDDTYRRRVATPADTVSPNALRRAANRILAPIGLAGCLREIGSDFFPGWYLDHDFLDYDFIARPVDRWRLLVDYLEMRAFFVMGVPPISIGEFGGFYDDDPSAGGFYDSGFYDGFPVTAAVIRRTIWQALYTARAGGVGFELVQELGGC